MKPLKCYNIKYAANSLIFLLDNCNCQCDSVLTDLRVKFCVFARGGSSIIVILYYYIT